jgi:hypothetical protein
LPAPGNPPPQNHSLERATATLRSKRTAAPTGHQASKGSSGLRFILLNVLPDRFVRIHYYELLANRNRKVRKMDWRERLQSLTGIDPMRCEVCGQKALRLVETLAPARAPRAPPQ